MNNVIKINKHEFPITSYGISIVLHVLIFFMLAFILGSRFNEARISSPYVQIITSEINKSSEIKPDEKSEEHREEKDPVKEEPAEDKKSEEKIEEKPKEIIEQTSSSYLAFSTDAADTNSLNQVYKESTLNVSIKYPVGWTYIDQNRKQKLDGVTFWSTQDKYDPPPYIHLEVKEKYLFNRNRFNFSKKYRNFTIYYNEPEELAGQVSQVLYIRTETDEDYSLKLIMKGNEAFRSFQPEFFGMVKTFNFGNSFF